MHSNSIGKFLPKDLEGVIIMFGKKSGMALVFFLIGIILWVITENVVFFILGISFTKSSQKSVTRVLLVQKNHRLSRSALSGRCSAPAAIH